MPEFVTLTCPSCGGKLDITPDVDRFACAHCGHEHIVKRGGGVISLLPVLDTIRTIGIGVDKTAAELALVRLDKELDQLQERKRQVIASMTPPKRTLAAQAAIAIGIVLLLLFFANMNSNNAAAALLLSIFLISIGGLQYRADEKAAREWEATFREAIAPIDANIAKKEDEKDTYLQIVESNPPSNR